MGVRKGPVQSSRPKPRRLSGRVRSTQGRPFTLSASRFGVLAAGTAGEKFSSFWGEWMTEREEFERRELVEARGYLLYWQRELRLDHMDFEIKFYNTEESEDKLGTCKVAPGRHRQNIILRHPLDRSERDREIFRHDLEVVVVHELLHTKEFPWRDHPTVSKVMDEDRWLSHLHEDSLDAVAEALVRARRGIRR